MSKKYISHDSTVMGSTQPDCIVCPWEQDPKLKSINLYLCEFMIQNMASPKHADMVTFQLDL